MTPEAFDQLFTREALRPFQPTPGSLGLEPLLEVTTASAVAVFCLALDNFNDGATRKGYLHALGHTCAAQYPDVEAVRFGSEAWVRGFTPEEAAARGTRLIEAYPDKEEAIIVFGQQPGGAVRIAQARLYRRPSGTVERLGSWEVTTEGWGQVQSPLLAAFWAGYLQGKGRTN
jgi:hypothetical protein